MARRRSDPTAGRWQNRRTETTSGPVRPSRWLALVVLSDRSSSFVVNLDALSIFGVPNSILC